MKKSRLVGKNGICNVYNTNVPKKDRQYLRDIFTTMIDVKWRYMLFIFALVFVLRYITTECPLAGFTVCLQALLAKYCPPVIASDETPGNTSRKREQFKFTLVPCTVPYHVLYCINMDT
ncbi:inward rectifier potassium channel [Ancylostoma ceylanicum]|uniref:Inward rectifier potassium channel n=1 Tax=Ancylostoma ceylanicum TaxID=53326 RepID=A0A0D6M7L2_9BILA|nr:inward rectifier potassium channel [Ancylostoma ceylanicum]